MLNKEDYIKNKIQQYYKNKSKNKKVVTKYIKLKNNDIMYRILYNLSDRINDELNKRNIKRTLTYMEFLGCSLEELKIHLQKQFVEEMNYDNYGKWEIDHIIPISKMNLYDIDEAKKCFNYNNF